MKSAEHGRILAKGTLPKKSAAMKDINKVLTKWKVDTPMVRQLVYTAESAREREGWHAVWLMTQGWTAVQVAKALEQDAHTLWKWMDNLEETGVEGLMFAQSGGC